MHQSAEELNNEAEILLQALGASPLTLKARLAIPPQNMPTQDPAIRRGNMQEVTTGYSEAQARVEASRCLQCKTAPCVQGCPVGIDIPRFIKAIEDGNFAGSVNIIKEASLLPAVCGRVCPQESQCQEVCTVGKSLKNRDHAVAIGRLERYVADREAAGGDLQLPACKPDTGRKIAIVGSGPAGIAAAADLRKEGHRVTIFEAFHKPGGVMVYGIPEFRLPKSIVKREIKNLLNMGVELRTNYLIGRSRKLKDLIDQDGFDAVFVGSGAGLPRFMDIDGEHLVGVFSANEYLTRSNLMKAYDSAKAATPLFPSKKVAVLGGGNVAMDAARTALRQGAEEVTIVYRRTLDEMPARVEEVSHAREEGVVFKFLTNAVQVLGDEKDRVRGLVCVNFELGEPDASGRRRPVQVRGSEHELDVDTVIVAIGNDSNPLIRQTTADLECTSAGNIIVDEHGKTSLPGIWAGGDIVLGAATVILAMGEGRRAAAAISRELAYQSSAG